MIRGLYTSASAMVSQQLKQEVGANNLANVNTAGFKKDSAFRKTLIDSEKILQMNSTDFKQMEEIDESYTHYKQGDFEKTDNPFHTAINGKGFFTVQTPNGPRYTRNGSFTKGLDGTLTTTNGYQVLGRNGAIMLPGEDVFIGENGEVTSGGQMIDTIVISDFPEPYNLTKMGDGLFSGDQNQVFQQTYGNYKLINGTLEDSNVNAVDEMVGMIETSRLFETNQKMIQMQDSTLDRAVNDIGRLK